MTLFHVLAVACAALYFCAFAILLWSTGPHCDYCHKRLHGDAELFHGAHVCDECRERVE